MAKTVKFNLILDGCPVRNIEGLREHFSIEDIIEYYNNGLLEKWLTVREYKAELEKVKAINISDDETDKFYLIAEELIRIFDIEIEESSIKESLAIFKYTDEKNASLMEYQNISFKRYKIIKDYHEGYMSLIKHMLDCKDDMALLKADAKEIEKSYMSLFELDYYRVYFELVKEAPRAIYAMLTRPKIRTLYLGENVPTPIQKSLSTDITPLNKIKANIADDISIVKRDTQGMWDPIERGDINVMVLHIASVAAFVKNYQGPLEEKLGNADTNGKFLLLKGLEYQCNSAATELVYMEV